MVVRIKYGKNIRGAISYNEQKVINGKAELIAAGRFGCDAGLLSFSQKLKRFTNLIDKCVTSDYSSVHLSLNFSKDDNLDNDKLQLIARDYLQGIGFDKQPYLVYRHYDANHTHVHIVTTPVKASGKAINLHNLVKLKSEPIRKQIEADHDLVKAQSKNKSDKNAELPVPKAIYGRTPTKQAISVIVRHVVDTYRFTYFEQFNAVLRQFNVMADTGELGTRMYKSRGLQYFITDGHGNKNGVPIKASSIYSNPGLALLQKKAERNKLFLKSGNQFTKSSVAFALTKSNTVKEATDLLEQKNITVAYDKNNSPLFIDNRNKGVYTLNDLQIPAESFTSLYHSTPIQLLISDQLAKDLFANEFSNQQAALEFYKRKRKKKR